MNEIGVKMNTHNDGDWEDAGDGCQSNEKSFD
jgi:hypothetical protein